MNTRKIIDSLGGTLKVAKIFNVTPGAVSQWIHSGIPEARLMYLKAVRPDIFIREDSTNLTQQDEP